jgi:predicted flap endonuclease-1-like 5' DNA nuclease
MTNSAANYFGLNIGTLILIGIGAVITVLAIIWGSMRRRAKAMAIADSERHKPAVRDADPDVADNMAEAEAPPPVLPPQEPPTIPMAPQAVPQEAVAVAPEEAAAPDAVDAPAADYPLTTLKGLGPRAATALGEQGISTVADLARLDPAAAAALDARLGALAGRIARDRWVEQALLLSRGDIAGFEAAFGKLGS